MRGIYWKPWIEETRMVINTTARYLFASLLLTFLVLANVAAVVVILNGLKRLVS